MGDFGGGSPTFTYDPCDRKEMLIDHKKRFELDKKDCLKYIPKIRNNFIGITLIDILVSIILFHFVWSHCLYTSHSLICGVISSIMVCIVLIITILCTIEKFREWRYYIGHSEYLDKCLQATNEELKELEQKQKDIVEEDDKTTFRDNF